MSAADEFAEVPESEKTPVTVITGFLVSLFFLAQVIPPARYILNLGAWRA